MGEHEQGQGGQQVPGGQEGGGASDLSPQSGCSKGPSAPIMRHPPAGTSGSVVTRILAALVERVNGGPEGMAGPAGRPDSRGRVTGPPPRGPYDLMVGAGAGGL